MIKRVKAIESLGSFLTKDNIYDVKEESDEYYIIIDDDGDEAELYKTRFIEIDRVLAGDVYKSWELAKLIHEKVLPQGTIVKWYEEDGTTFTFTYTIKEKSIRGEDGKEMGCSMLTSDHNYVIVDIPDQEVTFLEAIASGKRIRYEYEDARDGFEELRDCLDILGNKYSSDKIREIIEEGKWFIKN